MIHNAAIYVTDNTQADSQSMNSSGVIEVVEAIPTGFSFRWEDEGIIKQPWHARAFIRPQVHASVYPGADFLQVEQTDTEGLFHATSKTLTGRALAAIAATQLPQHMTVCIDCVTGRLVRITVHPVFDWSQRYDSIAEALSNMNAQHITIPREEVLRADTRPVFRMRDVITTLLARFS